MNSNFDLKRYLVENKLTQNSKSIAEDSFYSRMGDKAKQQKDAKIRAGSQAQNQFDKDFEDYISSTGRIEKEENGRDTIYKDSKGNVILQVRSNDQGVESVSAFEHGDSWKASLEYRTTVDAWDVEVVAEDGTVISHYDNYGNQLYSEFDDEEMPEDVYDAHLKFGIEPGEYPTSPEDFDAYNFIEKITKN